MLEYNLEVKTTGWSTPTNINKNPLWQSGAASSRIVFSAEGDHVLKVRGTDKNGIKAEGSCTIRVKNKQVEPFLLEIWQLQDRVKDNGIPIWVQTRTTPTESLHPTKGIAYSYGTYSDGCDPGNCGSGGPYLYDRAFNARYALNGSNKITGAVYVYFYGTDINGMDNCTQGGNGSSEKGATVSGDNRKWCRKSAWYARRDTFRKVITADGKLQTCDYITINSTYVTADEIINRWNSAIVNETSGSFRSEDDIRAKVKLKSCS